MRGSDLQHDECLATVTDVFVDPVVQAYKSNIDLTLIRKNLRLTPEQRIQQLMALQRFAVELRRAGRVARSKR